MSKTKKLVIISSTFIILLTIFIFFLARIILFNNINKSNQVLYFPYGTTYEEMIDTMNRHEFLKNEKTFRMASKIMRFYTIRPGKYHFSQEGSNRLIIQKLRIGQHYPVKFTFNNIRTKEQFIDRVGDRFLFEKDSLRTLLTNNLFLTSYGLNSLNAISVFIPDSYEFFYDITAEDFFNRMYYYYEKFWNEERKALAKSIGFTPLEISIIASIVEEENYKAEEKPIIAGVYINRLKKGMKLQADPTVKFAIGDFSLQRILYKHLEFDSPYNTYLYAGLPPGPIRIPDASTLDAVLHYTRHNYIYMCAKEDFSGAHNFAVTASEHARNAKKYREAIGKLQAEERRMRNRD